MKPLNERQLGTLEELLGYHVNVSCVEGMKRMCSPMDIGGSNSSHHSATLAGLVRRGLVLRTAKWGTRGSYRYALSPAGLAYLKEHSDYAEGALARMGPHEWKPRGWNDVAQ